jgi:hypothetical protein
MDNFFISDRRKRLLLLIMVIAIRSSHKDISQDPVGLLEVIFYGYI